MAGLARGLLVVAAAAAAAALAVAAPAADSPPARPRRRVRERRQPGDAGLPARRDQARRRRGLQRGRDRDGHTRRAGLVDARDRQGDPRGRRPGRRLRRATWRQRRFGRRRDRDVGGRARDGAADEHRLVDAGLDRRRGHLEGPTPQDRQRRRRLHRRARAGARPQRPGGARHGHEGDEPGRARGGGEERGRRPRGRLPGPLPPDRRDEDRAQGVDDLDTAGDADRPGRALGLEAPARSPDRPEHHRADALDRTDRDRRRALEPRPHLPGHGRGDLADRRPLRPPGAADLGGGTLADAARGRLLRRRGVHRLARRAGARGLDHVRDRSADALRSGRRRLPGLDARRGRDRRHARAALRPRADEGGAGAAHAGGGRVAPARRRDRGRPRAGVSSSSTASSGTPAAPTTRRSSRAGRCWSSTSTRRRSSSS